MDKCTHEVRLQYWRNIITQCQQRPAGQTARQWMENNGICEPTYYLWQRRIRQETFDQMSSGANELPAVTEKQEITFAEIPVPKVADSPDEQLFCKSLPVAVLRSGSCVIEISNDISDRILHTILQEVSNA